MTVPRPPEQGGWWGAAPPVPAPPADDVTRPLLPVTAPLSAVPPYSGPAIPLPRPRPPLPVERSRPYPYPAYPAVLPGRRRAGRLAVLLVSVLSLVAAGAVLLAGVPYVRAVAVRDRAAPFDPARAFGAEVDAQLRRRTDAVLRHDEKAFLGTVDPGQRSLLAVQRRTFRTLTRFPLDLLTYSAPVGGGVPSRVVRGGREYLLALRYRVRGAEEVPVGLGYDEHWVRHGGRMLLARETPKALAAAGSAQPGPVDTDALRVLNSPHVTLAATAGVAHPSRVLAAAEAAAVDALRVWQRRPGPSRFVAFVTTDRARFVRWAGRGLPSAEAIGYATPLFEARPAGSREPRQIVSSRVVVDLRRATTNNPDGVADTLRHEFGHAVDSRTRAPIPAAAGSGRPAYPVWVEEGFACYVEEIRRGTGDSHRLADVRVLARIGYWHRGLPSDDVFYADARLGAMNYGLAFLVFRFVADRYGAGAAVSFYAAAASAVKDPSRVVLRLDPAAFTRAWVAYVDGLLA